MDITATKHGLRLSQHGVVISELRTSAGPTHSVFDVLAALIAVLPPQDCIGRIGLLGFAGGGMMAPLHRLGVEAVIDSVDLDRAAYELFRRHCPDWTARVRWTHADAVTWLRAQPRDFDLLMDDLSVPCDGDVVKPDVCWNVLPKLMRARLRPGGFGVFNLLPSLDGQWHTGQNRMVDLFDAALLIELDEFQNRILVVGDALPLARPLGATLRAALRHLRSRQAERIRLRTFRPA